MDNKSIESVWTAITSLFGEAGAIAVIIALAVIGAIAVTRRTGPPVLLWGYLFLALIAAGNQTVEYRKPVLPMTFITMSGMGRWLVLSLLALIGLGSVIGGKVKMSLTTWLLLLWLFYATATSLIVSDDIVAFQRAVGFGMIVCAGFVGHAYISSYAMLDRFFRTFFWFSLAMIVFITFWAAVRPGLVFAGGRFRGTCDNANTMGIIALLMVAPSIWAWLDAHSTALRRLLGICGVLFWSAIVIITDSRAALIGIAPLMLIAMILGKKKIIAFWAAGAVLVGGVYMAPRFMTEAEARTDNFHDSFESRFHHITFGLDIMSNNPVFGHGYGYSSMNIRLPGNGRPLHNSYLNIGIDIGFVGLIVVIAAGLSSLNDVRIMNSICLRSNVSRAPPLLLGALLVAFLLNGIVEGWMTGIGTLQLYFYVVLQSTITGARHCLADSNRLQLVALPAAFSPHATCVDSSPPTSAR